MPATPAAARLGLRSRGLPSAGALRALPDCFRLNCSVGPSNRIADKPLDAPKDALTDKQGGEYDEHVGCQLSD